MSGHTPGPIHANKYGSVDDSRGNWVPMFGVTLLSGLSDKAREAEANRDLFIEAVNIATKTGLTPRQLAEQRAWLISALEHIAATCDGRPSEVARAAIAKAKGEA